jgi:hypothetical protein
VASEKISQFNSLTTVASGDYFPVVDISEALDANKNKSVQIGVLDDRFVNADGDTITGTLTASGIVVPSGGSLTIIDGASITGLPDTTQLINRSIPEINLNLIRGDTWDGFYMYLQEADGSPANLSNSTVNSFARTSTYDVITDLNTTVVTPGSGYIRVWASSAQTALLPATSGQQIYWDVQRTSDQLAAGVSGFTNSASGTLAVVTTSYPGLSRYDSVIVSGVAVSGLPANVYDVLYPTNPSGQNQLNLITSSIPYQFAIPELSTSGTNVEATGVYATGIALYSRRVDTLVRGIVFVTLP